jgi:hypothetical protein
MVDLVQPVSEHADPNRRGRCKGIGVQDLAKKPELVINATGGTVPSPAFPYSR